MFRSIIAAFIAVFLCLPATAQNPATPTQCAFDRAVECAENCAGANCQPLCGINAMFACGASFFIKPQVVDLDVLTLRQWTEGGALDAQCIADRAWIPPAYPGESRWVATVLECGDFEPFGGCSLRDPESGACLDIEDPPCEPGGTQAGPVACE